MMLTVFELFKIGIGPSSSHTVGPMLAGQRFAARLKDAGLLDHVDAVRVELYGSLALTGKGHWTDRAVLLGLEGELPASVAPEKLSVRVEEVAQSGTLRLLGEHPLGFDVQRDIVFRTAEVLPQHPNGMRFVAFHAGRPIREETFFSVGGGFIVDAGDIPAADTVVAAERTGRRPPFPFENCQQLLEICRRSERSIARIVYENELTWRTETQIRQGLDAIWDAMRASIARGCATDGTLPGGLGIRRRAPGIYRRLRETALASPHDPLEVMDWVSLCALAVNEENAAGGRVVTAPTNGAAGIIPAVLSYYHRFWPAANRSGVHNFLLTAGAIGSLYKRNASLSAAEMGCQGEVGVACSMAAAGLAAVMAGTPEQIENAAEIGMEHNLGLTCDPVAGLVQVPCIERNTMGAAKAVNAARLAVLYGNGRHFVSLDRVIETMRQTGLDMQSKYKETSLGGLAVNAINC